jgi:hypothetical protein
MESWDMSKSEPNPIKINDSKEEWGKIFRKLLMEFTTGSGYTPGGNTLKEIYKGERTIGHTCFKNIEWNIEETEKIYIIIIQTGLGQMGGRQTRYLGFDYIG